MAILEPSLNETPEERTQRHSLFAGYVSPTQSTRLGETPEQREQRHNLFRQSISPTVTTVPKNPVLTQTQSVVDPTDASSGMDYLTSRFTSPEQEEKYRKASVNRQRILAIGDALRHIGNIYNTVNYAPSQQFNDPLGTEYQRYQTDKNARDAANQRYISYRDAKAAQERQERMYEDQLAKQERDYQLKVREADRKERFDEARIARYDAQNAKDEASRAFYETKARLLEEGFPVEIAVKKAREAESISRTHLNNIRAGNGGSLPRTGGGGGGRRSGGVSSGGKYYLKLPTGETRYYQNQTMWQKDVDKYYPDDTLVSSGRTSDGTTVRTTQKSKSHTRRAAEGEKRADAARAAQAKTTSKGRTSKGSKGPYSGFSIHKK